MRGLAATVICALLVCVMTSMDAAPAFAAPKAETHRKILIRHDKKTGEVEVRRRIRYELGYALSIDAEFPIAGGQFTGTGRSRYVGCPFTCMDIRDRGTLKGTYDGKDGGDVVIQARWVDQDGDVSRDVLRGKIYAKGVGFLVDEDGDRYDFSFPPFETACKGDINEFEGKLYEEIRNRVIDAASQKMVDGFMKATRVVDRKVLNFLQKTRSVTLANKANITIARETVRDYLGKANDVVPDKFAALAGSASKVAVVFDAMVAASVSDYGKVAEVFAFDIAAGLYPPASVVMVPLIQATYEDWKKFKERAFAKYFRDFYEDLYYEDGRPNAKKGTGNRRIRLRNFVNASIDYLGTLDHKRGRPYRNLVRDFAYYKLNISLSYDDLAVVDGRNGETLKSKSAMSALASLFQAYERIYEKDREAEVLRRVTRYQAKAIERAANESEWALSAAQRNDFSKVWPEVAERKRVICGIINTAQKAYIVKQ